MCGLFPVNLTMEAAQLGPSDSGKDSLATSLSSWKDRFIGVLSKGMLLRSLLARVR